MSETTRTIIEQQEQVSLDDMDCRTETLRRAVANAGNLKKVKQLLDSDTEAGAVIGNQLENYRTDFHNRVVDIFQSGLVSRDIAESLLRLTGAHPYSNFRPVKLRQFEQVAYLRQELRDRYRSSVPQSERSAVFSSLIEAPMPDGKKSYVPEYGTFVERASIVVALGAVSSKSAMLDTDPSELSEANNATARSLIFIETARMLDFYYPQPSSD